MTNNELNYALQPNLVLKRNFAKKKFSDFKSACKTKIIVIKRNHWVAGGASPPDGWGSILKSMDF